MTITLSQAEYWALFQESVDGKQLDANQSEAADITWKYPSPLGRGFMRSIALRQGLELAIAEYQLHEDIIVYCDEREHPLEYTFEIAGGDPVTDYAIPCHLYGSGRAPADTWREVGQQRILYINVHIQPEVFRPFIGSADGQIPAPLQHLIRTSHQKYYVRSGLATPAMQISLRQILQCPYQGCTQRLFLESKVLELLAGLLEQEVRTPAESPVNLKPDDVDRIHQARAILLQHLSDPPSLNQLARLVGLNECSLKRGFRQVFGTTAFGYLHHYRLEQAQQLLMHGEMTVAQVAQAIGFARNYFTRAFRQKFGCTPGAYRRGQG